MDIKNQVCSLELAKWLNKLGVKQESYFWWEHITEMPTSTGVQKSNHWRITTGAYRDRFVSAFTVAELDALLPASIEARGNQGYLTIRIVERNGRRHYDVCYLYNLDHVIPGIRSYDPADVRAGC